MARIELTDRETILDISFRKARIEDIDFDNDTAHIEILNPDESGTGEKYEDVPIYYHCEPDVNVRGNGALEGASAAFEIDDSVLVQFVGGQILIMGRVDGLKSCENKKLAYVLTDDNEYRFGLAGDEPGSLECKEAKNLDRFSALEIGERAVQIVQKKYRIDGDPPIDYYVIMKKYRTLSSSFTYTQYWIYTLKKKELIDAGSSGTGFNVSLDKKTVYTGGWGGVDGVLGSAGGTKLTYDEDNETWSIDNHYSWSFGNAAIHGTAPDSDGKIKVVWKNAGSLYTCECDINNGSTSVIGLAQEDNYDELSFEACYEYACAFCSGHFKWACYTREEPPYNPPPHDTDLKCPSPNCEELAETWTIPYWRDKSTSRDSGERRAECHKYEGGTTESTDHIEGPFSNLLDWRFTTETFVLDTLSLTYIPTYQGSKKIWFQYTRLDSRTTFHNPGAGDPEIYCNPESWPVELVKTKDETTEYELTGTWKIPLNGLLDTDKTCFFYLEDEIEGHTVEGFRYYQGTYYWDVRWNGTPINIPQCADLNGEDIDFLFFTY